MKRWTRVVFFLYLAVVSLFSQNLRFRHLSVEDGLSQNTINCIYQDHYGYIWCGTQDGLNRYDGYQFTVYKHNPLDSTSLSHSWVWYINEDRDRNLWIATWQGLNRYDPVQDKFIRYLHTQNGNANINGQRPTSLCTDSSGTFWVGTWGNGLKYYVPEQDRFVPFKDERLPSALIRTIYLDRKGVLWIGTWNGLVRMVCRNGQCLSLKVYRHQAGDAGSLSSDRVTSVLEDHQGSLWVGTLGGGLNRFSPQTDGFEHFLHHAHNPNTLSHNDVACLLEDREHQLWIGTVSGGLDKLDRASGRFLHFRYQPDDPFSLSGNKIYSLLQDRSGLVWIGANGLNLMSKKLNRFEHFRHNPHDPKTLSHNKIWAFCLDGSQTLWIGTDGGGLNQYLPQKAQFISYKNEPENPNSLSCDNVSSLLCEPSHTLWIGTRGGGLNRYNMRSKKFIRIRDDSSLPGTKGLNYIMSLCFDIHHNLWIGTFDQGIIVFDIRHQRFKKYKSNPVDSLSLSGNYISTLFRDSKGMMWVGGWGGGLCRFNERDGTFTRFLHVDGNPKSLISNIVHTIYETNQKGRRILWVGTSSGLSYLELSDLADAPFHHIPAKGLLSNEVIYGILDDIDGNLWLSSNHGLYRLNPHTLKVKRFSPSDGLQSNEFNAGSCLKGKNGQLFFGGVNGFNAFYPHYIKASAFEAPIQLTSFKIFDQALPMDKKVLKANGIHLKYWQNFFSFEFSAFDFNAPGENRYKYKMEGLDRKWIDAGTRHYASYTNLAPGNYTLRIQGSNSDGIWSDREVALNIIISPPFWRTWWFRLIALFILLVSFYFLYRIRLARMLEIERLRVQIASDLHDDLGSALTKIAINSEIIQNTKEYSRIAAMARSIGEISRAVIVTMSDIIWSIDARNDTIGDLLDRMKDMAVDLLSAKDIQLEFLITGFDPGRKMAIDLRQNLFLIYKEAINNISRHSGATDVRVELRNSNGRFVMKITDNGRGLNLGAALPGNGIKNMKMRAKRIDARIEFFNRHGTVVLLKRQAI